MRIAQIVPVIRIGGILYHLRVMRALFPAFESVHVSLFDANDAEAVLELGQDVVCLGLPLKEYGNSTLVRQALRKALSKIAPHTVHSHHNFSDWYAIPVAHDLGVKAIRTVHGITQRDLRGPLVVAPKKLDWSEEEKARQLSLDYFVARTLAVSSHLREKLIDYGFASNKVSVLYPGISALDPKRCNSLDRLRSIDGLFHIAFPHRLEPIKNPDLMVEIVKRLVDEGLPVRTYLPRIGTRLVDIEAKITRAGIGSSIEWLTRGVDIWKQIPHADVLLLTSLSEGLPVTVLEAMVRSIPIVAPRVGGIPEAVVDGETGLLVDGETCDAYVSALRVLAGDYELRLRLGAVGRERAAACFGLESHLENLSNVYRSLDETS